MIVATCEHKSRKVHGKTKAGSIRYRCNTCGKTFTDSTAMFGGMRIGLDKAVQIIELLCEDMSIAATARISRVDPSTVTDLMVMVGEQCDRYMAQAVIGVAVQEIQVDEIWQFVFCKAKTAEQKHYVGGCGDSYCFTAVERSTKFLVAWHFGRRTLKHTETFCEKLSRATTGRFHLSSDGFQAYPTAIRHNLSGRVDYGMLVKIFGHGDREDIRRYSPAKIISAARTPIYGNPDREKICTSHSERLNGSIRNFVKRMGRLTYCFSKRWNNHRAALGLFFCYYNWCRKHKSLKGLTPAQAHGLADHRWTVRVLLENVFHT